MNSQPHDQLVAEKNVQLNVDRIRKESTILHDMEATGEVVFMGA